MSIMQRLSMIGLYDYDPGIFDNLKLPDGYDKATFINNLLLEHGEKLVLYTDPDFMKLAIGMWSNKWALELSRIYEALIAEYNPIWNYDRYEEIKDGRGKKYTSQLYANNKLDKSQQIYSAKTRTNKPKYDDDLTNDYDVTVSQQVDGTVEHQVSADNSSNYQPDYKDIQNVGETTTSNDGTIKRHIEGTTEDITESGNSTLTDGTVGSNNSTTTDNETENKTHDGHMWGNIGVTTAASMVTEVVEQRLQYNLYSIATKLFATELLIGIY